MTITPDKVLRTDMTKNLTPDEAVAVDDFGHVLSRADRATIESAYPGHAIFGAKDFAALDAPEAEEPKARKAKVEEPAAPVVEEPKAEEPAAAEPANEDAVIAAEGERPEAVESAPAKDPLDHDGDGVSGGSEAGENSTAAKGARNRKAKTA
jgi:hypothetical protein